MAMPSTVEQYRRYRDARRFEADRRRMEDAGWRVASVTPRSVRRWRVGRAIPSMSSHREELDVLYTRSTWYPEDAEPAGADQEQP